MGRDSEHSIAKSRVKRGWFDWVSSDSNSEDKSATTSTTTTTTVPSVNFWDLFDTKKDDQSKTEQSLTEAEPDEQEISDDEPAALSHRDKPNEDRASDEDDEYSTTEDDDIGSGTYEHEKPHNGDENNFGRFCKCEINMKKLVKDLHLLEFHFVL